MELEICTTQELITIIWHEMQPLDCPLLKYQSLKRLKQQALAKLLAMNAKGRGFKPPSPPRPPPQKNHFEIYLSIAKYIRLNYKKTLPEAQRTQKLTP